MRIIVLSTLKAFWADAPQYADAEGPATAWYRQAKEANWKQPADVKADVGNASILQDGRVVFNIAGNKYRLVVWISYDFGIIYVRFIGTHKLDDKINAQTIWGALVNIKPIKTDADYRAALKDIEGLMNAKPNTLEGDKLDILATLVEAYEAKHFPMELPDPVEAIRFRMEQSGLTVKDLVPAIGQTNRVCEVLSGRRSLTLAMVWKLHKMFNIPAESLIRPAKYA